MARSRSSGKNSNNSTANLGFEAKLWLAADKLRSNMDAFGERTPLACPDSRPRGSAKHTPTTRRLAVMNLALRGIEADFGPEHADSVEMSNSEVRMTNRTCSTSPFEIRHSNFA